MLKALCNWLWNWLGIWKNSPDRASTKRAHSSGTPGSHQLPPISPPTSPVSQTARPKTPGPDVELRPLELYSHKPFTVDKSHVDGGAQYLFTNKSGRRQGPTPQQAKVIYSNSGAISVLAGAGSGKSTTLVSRVLFLHKILKVPLGNMAVFTFTRKSREDFIRKLVEEAKRWNVPLKEERAARLVRTFHSKALQIASTILSKEQKIFEFLGKEMSPVVPKTADKDHGAEPEIDTPTNDTEEQANQIEGFVDLEESEEQAELLKDVYASCYNADKKFRQAISILFDHTVRTAPLGADEKYDEKLQYLSLMSRNDDFLCDHLEEKWTNQKSWPIQGITPRGADGSRFTLDVMGTPFFANGYIRDWDLYVILGRYDGINNDQISRGKQKLKPAYAVSDKRLVLLTDSPKRIRYIKSKRDAEELRKQLAMLGDQSALSAPALEIRLPGEYNAKPVFSSFYTFGMFAENLGLDPGSLNEQVPGTASSDSEKAALYAVSMFYREFHKELTRRSLITFNQLFAKLSEGSPDLANISVAPLIGVKHLMIDEFQDISPLVVKFVRGLHRELINKSKGSQKPSLMCVGDDWQSIYGWRGSSPHFLTNRFAQDFPGAERTPILLEENFRSSQLIIDCGESFIHPVEMKSLKKGVASNPAVKDLPYKVVSVEKYQTEDVTNALRVLLQCAEEDESVYLLAATHDDLEPYRKIRDSRVTKTTFHQSKGLEAEYVVLVGASSAFGSNNLKNELYKLASFPQSFDKAQQDEAFRVAYVAATRAKKFCVWYAAPNGNNVISAVPADERVRQVMDAKEVPGHISRTLGHVSTTTK